MVAPDPDRDRSVMERLDPQHYGDGDQDQDYGELAGVAPPCDECGSREATSSVDGRDLCDVCRTEIEGDA